VGDWVGDAVGDRVGERVGVRVGAGVGGQVPVTQAVQSVINAKQQAEHTPSQPLLGLQSRAPTAPVRRRAHMSMRWPLPITNPNPNHEQKSAAATN
jgi:hypothetical protein